MVEQAAIMKRRSFIARLTALPAALALPAPVTAESAVRLPVCGVDLASGPDTTAIYRIDPIGTPVLDGFVVNTPGRYHGWIEEKLS